MLRLTCNLLLLLVGIIFGLLVIEGGVRLSAIFFPKVAFLTTIGRETPPYYSDTLEDYVKTPGLLLTPHSSYLGCKTNALGLNDEEFTTANTDILAVGDSFLFGRVPYTKNVITLLEGELGRRCRSGKEIPIANLGIAGLQPRDYLEVIKLALKKYKPRTILLHLYLGNDFPQIADLDHLVKGAPKQEKFIKKYITSHLRLVSLYDNLKRIWKSGNNQPKVIQEASNDTGKTAGQCRQLSQSEKDYLNQPAFSSKEWLRIVGIEAGRFYLGTEHPEELTRMRQQLIEPMEAIAQITKERGVRLITILSPSQFPVRPDLRKWFFEKRALGGGALRSDRFDLEQPSRVTGQILSRLGIRYIDISPFLRTKMLANPHTQYYAAGDTHWNEAGNMAVAEILGVLLEPLLCPG